MAKMEHRDVVVVGGGPAGLTAAYQLIKAGRTPLVLEMSDLVGGIARTETYKGYRFDIGGHRYFTKVPEVEALWHEVLQDDLIQVPRLSRIFYRDKFYSYPLQVRNALENLGLYEAIRILLSYTKWRLRPSPEEENFEQWVINRFGGRLYWHFFRTYTEKVWGMPCTRIRADWAAQRIKNLSLTKAVFNALTGANDTSSLIKSFEYPRLGPGMMWERFASKVEEGGGEVRMNTRVIETHHNQGRVTHVTVQQGDEAPQTVAADAFISSMPLSELILQMQPAPPAQVVRAARSLCYRDFLIVTLIVDAADPFPDNWIYIHSPKVKVGRIQNFKAWSKELVPDPSKASLGMEYFCHQGDGLWTMDDAELIALARKEIGQLGLVDPARVIDGTVIRQEKAYPVYDEDYAAHVDTIRRWLDTLENFHTVGRNGMHRYNNQDHSMLTAMLAVRNILGEQHDLWNVNVERSYHEEFVTPQKDRQRELAEVG